MFRQFNVWANYASFEYKNSMLSAPSSESTEMFLPFFFLSCGLYGEIVLSFSSAVSRHQNWIIMILHTQLETFSLVVGRLHSAKSHLLWKRVNLVRRRWHSIAIQFCGIAVNTFLMTKKCAMVAPRVRAHYHGRPIVLTWSWYRFYDLFLFHLHLRSANFIHFFVARFRTRFSSCFQDVVRGTCGNHGPWLWI